MIKDPTEQLERVLVFVMMGYTDKQIAEKLGVTENSVTQYIFRLKYEYIDDPRFGQETLFNPRVLLALLGFAYFASKGKPVDIPIALKGDIKELSEATGVELAPPPPSKNGKKKQPVSSSRFVSRSSVSDGASGQRSGRRKAS